MNPLTLFRQLEKEEILPVYYLYGNETYMLEEAVRNIKKRLIPPGLKDFNYETFFGGNNDASDIIHAACTFPIMSERRMVVVKDAHLLPIKDLEELTSYISNPLPSSCLIFISEKIDSRRKFFINLKKCGVIVKLDHPKDGELAYWIQKMATGFDKEIGKDGIAFLVEIVGNNLQEIYNEIEKVSIFIGDNATIGLEDLQEVVSELRVENIFALIDSVGNKDREKALTILQKMLASGEDHLKILGMIMYRFRLIFRAKDLMQKGLPPSEMGKRLGIRSFLVKGLLEQARRFSRDDFNEAFGQFFNTDLTLKSSRVAKKLILERLILELCV